MEINIHKLLGLVKTTIFQLLCPWQISLHPIIAYAGYFFYSLLILWALSFHIKAVAIFLNHFFYIIAFCGSTIEIYIAKLLNDPFLENKHKIEQKFIIKRFKLHCTLSKFLFKLKDFFK